MWTHGEFAVVVERGRLLLRQLLQGCVHGMLVRHVHREVHEKHLRDKLKQPVLLFQRPHLPVTPTLLLLCLCLCLLLRHLLFRVDVTRRGAVGIRVIYFARVVVGFDFLRFRWRRAVVLLSVVRVVLLLLTVLWEGVDEADGDIEHCLHNVVEAFKVLVLLIAAHALSETNAPHMPRFL